MTGWVQRARESFAEPGSARYAYAGLVLGCALVATVWVDPRREATVLLGLIAVAAVAYGMAIWWSRHGPPRSVSALAVCLLLSAAWRVPLLVHPPVLSDDVYRYLWDGRLQHLGHSPYGAPPDDPALQSLHTPLTRLTNNPDLPTIYPPGAQWFFWAVTGVHESLLAMKLAFFLCEIGIVVLLLRWLRAVGQSPWWVLAYAWNPLVTLEVSGSGHLDVLGVLFVVASGYALAIGRPRGSAVSLALAVAVKFLPVVLVPLYWRRLRARDWVAAAVVGLVLSAPFVARDGGARRALPNGGDIITQGQGAGDDGAARGDQASVPSWLPIGSLAYYLEKWRFNAPIFVELERRFAAGEVAAAGSALPAAQPALLALPLMAGLLTAAGIRWWGHTDGPGTWAWPMAATLVCMPAIYPWYLLWLTPFLWSPAVAPLAGWTVSILPVYVVLEIFRDGGEWIVPGSVLTIEYAVPVLLVLAALAGRARLRAGRPTAHEASR